MQYKEKDKFKFNRWGKIKITHMLRLKGISEKEIQDALELIDHETYIQTCMELINTKALTLKEKNMFARKSKLYNFAAGRGFEPDIIHRVLGKIMDD